MKSKEPIVKKKREETRKNKKDTPQYHFDLRQDIAWNLYIDQRSESFNNAYKSAVKAGFSDSTSRCISSETWWINKVKLLAEMLPLAEKILMEDMEMETKIPILINQKIEYKVDSSLRKIRNETAKFIGSTVGRNKYHTKTEVETTNIISLVQGNPLLDNLFKKKEKKD